MKCTYLNLSRLVSKTDNCEIYSMLGSLDITPFKFDINNNLPNNFDYSNFRELLFFSLRISFKEKERIIEMFSSLSEDQISKLQILLEDEKSTFISRFNKSDFTDNDEEEDIRSLEIDACYNACRIINNYLRKKSCLNLKYQFLATKDLERVFTLAVSHDGKIALTGFGNHEAGLIHINITKKIIVESYWIPGQYVVSMDIDSNSKAIVGTNNGYLSLIDLNREELIQRNKIYLDDDPIKCVKFSLNKNIVFAASQKLLIAADTDNLQVLYSEKIDFNPWDIFPIPNTDMVAVAGSQNRLEVFKSDGLSFYKVDSITCGSISNRDVSSLVFDTKNKLLISTSESGFLDMWSVSSQGLEKKHRIDIKDKIYCVQCIDNYIAFSASQKGVFLLNTENNILINIPDSCHSSELSLRKIGESIFLMFFAENSDICVIDITNDNWELPRLVDFQGKIDHILLTCDGNIIGASNEGIILANIFEYEKNNAECDFKVEQFVFNQNNESVLLQCKDNIFRQLSLSNGQWLSIELPKSTEYLQINDFVDNRILMSNSSEVSVFILLPDTITQENIDIDKSSHIKDAKLLGINHYAVLTACQHDTSFDASSSIDSVLNIYDFEGKEISSKNLGFSFFSMFVCHNKLLDQSIITNLETNDTLSFDVDFSLSAGHFVISNDLKLCLHLSRGVMFCADLCLGGTRIWKIEDPRLKAYSPLGYCKLINAFIIVDKITSTIIAVSEHDGNVINIYKIPNNIEKIEISSSGEHIAWTSKTNEFSFISFPFQSCVIHDEFKPWRTKYSYNEKEDKMFLKRISVGELWVSTIKRLSTKKFRSSESKNHQLDPWEFSLSIPDMQFLMYFDTKKAITSLMGTVKRENYSQSENSNVATIYHELFHVFQSSATKSVFDYFFLIDRIQIKRASILKFLGKLDFFNYVDDSDLEKCRSIFHCADNCGIDNLKKLSDLNLRDVEKLTRYFDNPNDLNVHTFEIIEGSAQVFGLCCGGYDVISKLDLELNEIEFDDSVRLNPKLYLKAYELFRTHGGKTPIVFIILCLSSLKYGAIAGDGHGHGLTPPDIFAWGLKKLENWEIDFSTFISSQEITENIFQLAAYQLIERMSNSISGEFFIRSPMSTHDNDLANDNKGSVFIQRLVDIRNNFVGCDNLNFLIDMVINKQVCYSLAANFNAASKQMNTLLRTNRAVRDYENFLINYDPNNYTEFKIYCCPEHPERTPIDDWYSCEHSEGFKNILLNEFGIIPPKSFLM